MDNLISRHAAINAIDSIIPQEGETWYSFYHKVINRINKIQAFRTEMKWIPVTDGLPKFNKPVLISVKRIGKEECVFMAEFRRRVNKSNEWKVFEYTTMAYDTVHEVLAWMPLPEPYKEVENDNKSE